ncbi:hypothetical protein GCM10009541_33830 [Micromonospora gifhornensis]|uniref:Uncharacterized protein n=1 Tax=Micromonospora gifhornensis TaxID=84594 RepID=A0ABQ4IAG2_9ACTN|nr:hypothetical protein Vgi01_15480 [Micromonospora gifhornensis]
MDQLQPGDQPPETECDKQTNGRQQRRDGGEPQVTGAHSSAARYGMERLGHAPRRLARADVGHWILLRFVVRCRGGYAAPDNRCGVPAVDVVGLLRPWGRG